MDPIHQAIAVRFTFPVHFTTEVFASSNPVLRDVVSRGGGMAPARILFVVDDGVARHHPTVVKDIERYCQDHADALTLAAPVLVVPGGETIKNDARHVADLHRVIHDAALCRHSYVAAVGGGAVLDAVGYAAATAHRGIRMIRVATTILAQDDSAVGVKNGINAFGKKNYLGTFAPPFAVINDSNFLHTLSDRDWRGGLTEAVKAALIRDRAFFERLEQQATALAARDPRAAEDVIRRSAEIHLTHIASGGDPFESGSSRPLDFGHWAAHKLEQLTNHRLGHGEAVGIGLALDTTYSHLSGLLPEADWRRVIALLRALGLELHAPELSQCLDRPDDPACVLGGLDEFREHLGGRLTIMLLRGIGDPVDVHEIDRNVMIRSIGVLEGIHDYEIPAQSEGTRR
jgi:3-dehydroquinate synthase